MELKILTRKMRCKDCGQLAKFKLIFEKTTIELCEDCLKDLNKNLAKQTTPRAVITKFYLKR